MWGLFILHENINRKRKYSHTKLGLSRKIKTFISLLYIFEVAINFYLKLRKESYVISSFIYEYILPWWKQPDLIRPCGVAYFFSINWHKYRSKNNCIFTYIQNFKIVQKKKSLSVRIYFQKYKEWNKTINCYGLSLQLKIFPEFNWF